MISRTGSWQRFEAANRHEQAFLVQIFAPHRFRLRFCSSMNAQKSRLGIEAASLKSYLVRITDCGDVDADVGGLHRRLEVGQQDLLGELRQMLRM